MENYIKKFYSEMSELAGVVLEGDGKEVDLERRGEEDP
jgi:hypothetical protein